MNQRILVQAIACLTLLFAVYGPPRTAKRFHGQVVFAAPYHLVLHIGGQDVQFFPRGDIEVTLDGKSASLESIHPGDHVTVYAAGRGQQWALESVEASTYRLDESLRLTLLDLALNR
jgi:hypothetical protein